MHQLTAIAALDANRSLRRLLIGRHGFATRDQHGHTVLIWPGLEPPLRDDQGRWDRDEHYDPPIVVSIEESTKVLGRDLHPGRCFAFELAANVTTWS